MLRSVEVSLGAVAAAAAAGRCETAVSILVHLTEEGTKINK